MTILKQTQMILKTQITQTKEIEITLPVFYKEDGYDNYIGVLNEQTVARFYVNNTGDYVSVANGTPDFYQQEIEKAINKKWSKISEVDFLQAYDDALSAISLRPKLNESFVDTLQSLDLKRNGG